MATIQQSEFKALKDLTKTIDEANRLRQEIHTLETKKQKLHDVNLSYEHPHFPFYKATDKLEEDAKKKTPLRIAIITLITTLFSTLIAVIPLVIHRIISPTFDSITLGSVVFYSVLAISIILFIIVFIKIIPLVFRKTMHIVRQRLIIKRQEDLNIAQAESMNMCEEYQEQLDQKIVDLNKQLTDLKKNLSGHERVINDSKLISSAHYDVVHELLAYFEAHRADTVKEAINLYETETRTHFYFTRLLEGVRDQNLPSDKLFESDFDIEAYYQSQQETEVAPQKEALPSDVLSEAYLLGLKAKKEQAQAPHDETKPLEPSTIEEDINTDEVSEKEAKKQAKQEEKAKKKEEAQKNKEAKQRKKAEKKAEKEVKDLEVTSRNDEENAESKPLN